VDGEPSLALSIDGGNSQTRMQCGLLIDWDWGSKSKVQLPNEYTFCFVVDIGILWL